MRGKGFSKNYRRHAQSRQDARARSHQQRSQRVVKETKRRELNCFLLMEKSALMGDVILLCAYWPHWRCHDNGFMGFINSFIQWKIGK